MPAHSPEVAPQPKLAPLAASRPASVMVSDIIRAWPRSETFSARRILEEHPDWSQQPSLVLDLACEEYARRTSAGEPLQVTQFVRDYPEHASALRQLILIGQVFDGAPMPFGATTLEWPAEGEEIAGFRLVEALGRGSLSRVFLAEELSLDSRLVVLKFVPLDSREAVLLARTQHPHVMSIHSRIPLKERGLTAICMPFVGRATLYDVIDHATSRPARKRSTAALAREFVELGLFDPAQTNVEALLHSGENLVEFILRIGIALAEALAEAHDRGVAHRDLKPSNVLLTFAAEPQLLDFNLASGAESDAHEGGTIPYMPPERLKAWLDGDPASTQIDQMASDIFSFGAMLFEVLAGRHPFGVPERAGSHRELMASQLERVQQGPSSLQAANPCVNGSLARLVASTLQTDPNDRPPSMQALAEKLKAELKGNAWIARRIRSRPGRSLTGVLAVSLLIAATSAWAPRAWERFNATAGETALTEGNTLPMGFNAAVQGGLASLERGDPNDALVQFERALQERSDGRVAALAAVAALRSRSFTGEARVYLRKADSWGHSSVEHENNWGVCELRSGDVEAAQQHFIPLLTTASAENLPTVLLNCMEAELRQAGGMSQLPNRKLLRDAMSRCQVTPWHQLGMARLCAAELRVRRNSVDHDEILRDLFESARRAAAGGIAAGELEGVAKLLPGLRDDSRWREIVSSTTTAADAAPQREPTLIPRGD